MCGIIGYFSIAHSLISADVFYKAHLKIAHRGKDDEGFIGINNERVKQFKGDHTAEAFNNLEHLVEAGDSWLFMGHRRLSIIDLSAHGHQPFNYEQYYMVYNGEIYNYIEIREDLLKHGYIFTTNTDVEVFIKAFHCWNINAFKKLNGMWAVAIYDENQRCILLSRDRFGIKPLYYYIKEQNIYFCSEIKSILPFIPELRAEPSIVVDYLKHTYLDHDEKTMIKGIYQLKPGTYAWFDKKGLTKRTYWKLRRSKRNNNKIESLLVDSIKKRLRSDVEVGTLLSGGIDSSTIVGLIKYYRLTNKLNTFSVIFENEKYSEKKYIEEMIRKTNYSYHYIIPKPEELKNEIDDLIYTMDFPFRTLSVYAQYKIYQYISNNTNTKVLLNGQGADEIFSGYTEHIYSYLSELLLKLKIFRFKREVVIFSTSMGKNKNLLVRESISYAIKYFIKWSLSFILTILLKKKRYRQACYYNNYRILSKNILNRTKPQKYFSILKNNLYSNITFSALKEYLRYEDRNSMRYTLESRLPYLDYRLVENVFNTKSINKIRNGYTKAMLRDIGKDKVADNVLNRTDKMGFITPHEIWQKTNLGGIFDDEFSNIQKNGIFSFLDKQEIYRAYLDYRENKNDEWLFIWRVFCLSKWKKIFNIN